MEATVQRRPTRYTRPIGIAKGHSHHPRAHARRFSAWVCSFTYTALIVLSSFEALKSSLSGCNIQYSASKLMGCFFTQLAIEMYSGQLLHPRCSRAARPNRRSRQVHRDTSPTLLSVVFPLDSAALSLQGSQDRYMGITVLAVALCGTLIG